MFRVLFTTVVFFVTQIFSEQKYIFQLNEAWLAGCIEEYLKNVLSREISEERVWQDTISIAEEMASFFSDVQVATSREIYERTNLYETLSDHKNPDKPPIEGNEFLELRDIIDTVARGIVENCTVVQIENESKVT